MDTATNTDEVRLHKGESLNERLVFAGLAIGLCVLGLATSGIGAIATFLIGSLMLAGAILRRSILWIITPGKVLIREQRPFGQPRSRLIRSVEISEMRIKKNDARFSLALRV